MAWLGELPANYYVEVIAKEKGLFLPWDKGIVDIKTISIKELEAFKSKYLGYNLHRSLTIYKSIDKASNIGKFPIIFDFDLDLKEPIGTYSATPKESDLENVCEASTQAILLLQDTFQIHNNKLKIFFSGRRGFHIKIKDDQTSDHIIREKLILNMRQINNIPESCSKNIIAEGVIIDSPRDFIRLRDSWNSWTDPASGFKQGKCFELSINDLLSLNAGRIMSLSNS